MVPCKERDAAANEVLHLLGCHPRNSYLAYGSSVSTLYQEVGCFEKLIDVYSLPSLEEWRFILKEPISLVLERSPFPSYTTTFLHGCVARIPVLGCRKRSQKSSPLKSFLSVLLTCSRASVLLLSVVWFC